MSIKNEYSISNTASDGILFGIGNPLLDISADVDDSMLTKYGLDANAAILCEAKHVPIYKDIIDNFNVQYLPGGATQNTIRGFAWALQNNPEAKKSSVYTGCVGNDDYKAKLTSAAEEVGLTVKYTVNEKCSTGTCACLITSDGKNRSLVANLAAAAEYQQGSIIALQEDLDRAKYFYSSGFFLTNAGSPADVKYIGEHCAKNGKTFITNLSAPFIPQFFGAQLSEAISYASIVFGNETEAAVWAVSNGIPEHENNLPEIAKAIAAQPNKTSKPRLVVLTHGCENTIVCQNGIIEEFPVDKVDNIVDTNGAGDAFVAGFIGGLVYNKSIKECVACGNYVASKIIQMPGCTFPDSSEKKF